MDNKKYTENQLVSIIVATYNAGKTLEQTLKSIATQIVCYELIIIDGASSDNTLTIIDKYSSYITYLISESDSGIYEAMNKGIDKATGKWIYFLGADDTLEPGILNEIYPLLKNLDVDIIYGEVVYETGRRFKSHFGLKTWLQNTVHHQGAFYNQRLFKKFRYDINYKSMADYELNLLIYKWSGTIKAIPLTVAKCMSGGSSFNLQVSVEEMNSIRGKHIGKLLNSLLARLLRLKYYIHYVLLRKV